MKPFAFFPFLLLVLLCFSEANAQTPAGTSEEVFITYEVYPEFPGGEAELFKYLEREMVYPAEAKELAISGKVYVGFVIEKNGEVTGDTLLRGIGHGCDEEALRLVRGMPKWKPGEMYGKPMRVNMKLPIQFKLVGKE